MRHFGKYLFLGVLVAAIPFSVSRAVFILPQGGLGVNRIPQGAWIFGNGQNPVGASSSPTVGFLTATSTTASSSFANGINLTSGCFAVNGTCISAGASLSFTAPLSLLGSTVSIPQASGLADGYLSSTDWTTFNTKFATTSTDYWLTTKSTTNLTEGSNLYYTDARVNTLLNASTTIPNRLCATNEILKWNGSTWVCGTDNNTDAFGYLFPSNATSTTLTFNGGLIATQATSSYLNVSSFLNVSGTSSFATATVSRLNNTIMVDGTRYPQTAAGIQSAINTCSTLAAAGQCAEVFIPPNGTYIVSSPITLKTGVSVRGASTTLLMDASPAVHGGIFTINNQKDIAIEGFNFRVGGEATAITSYGHDTLTIQNNTFTGTTTAFGGIILLDGELGSAPMTNTVIAHNKFFDVTAANRDIHLYPRNGNTVSRTKIYKNEFVRTYGPAIYLAEYDRLDDTQIEGNTFLDLTGGSAPTDPAVAVFGGLSTGNYLITNTLITNNHYRQTNTRLSKDAL